MIAILIEIYVRTTVMTPTKIGSGSTRPTIAPTAAPTIPMGISKIAILYSRSVPEAD